MKMKIVRENIDFQRGKDPKESMDIGLDAEMRSEYGKLWKIFKRCNDLSHISHNFKWVSEIQFDDPNPYFNIESYFYYTDEDDNKYPLNYVIQLFDDHIYCKEVIGKNEEEVRTVREFVEFTEAFEEDKQWQGVFEGLDFERGQDPKESINIGLRYKKDLKKGDTFLVWDKKFKKWDTLIAETSVKKEYTTIDEYQDLIVSAHEAGGSWVLEATCIWNMEEERWEYLAQLRIQESYNFERGRDPKDAMEIGYDKNVINFLNQVKEDHSLDTSSDMYLGYVNYGADKDATVFIDPELERGYKKFIKDWKRYLPFMREKGLYLIDPPEYEETIIYDEPEPEYGVHAITEMANFERGQDPKDAMGIGRKAYLKNWAKEIDWDWYPDPEELEREEVLDLKQYKGFNVKIAKISDRDEDFRTEAYYAVSDTGEPYAYEPTFYEDPEDAWIKEQHFLDEYSEEIL